MSLSLRDGATVSSRRLCVGRDGYRGVFWRAFFGLQHPDKNKSADATRKFQALGVVHAVLSDAEKRAVYDETGVIDDSTGEAKEWCVPRTFMRAADAVR
jgi:hypothetical protein